MSSFGSKYNKKGDPLNKRIPQNPKYKNVKSTIDTGASVTNFMRKIEDVRKNYKFSKDEIFRRMKVTTFAQLVIQVERISHFNDDFDNMSQTSGRDTVDPELAAVGGDDTDRAGGGGSPAPSLALTATDYGRGGGAASTAGGDTTRSTLLSVAQGVGELDLNQPPASGASAAPPPPGGAGPSPYLLLDVRDRDEYDQCHIISAVNYPKAHINRCNNYEIREMLEYKNKPGRIIIVYDDDERTAAEVARTLVQRGYDNLFMLSGGLKVAYQKFPEGFVTGTPPPSVTGKPLPRGAAITGATQAEFTAEDVDRVEMYLDHALTDKSSSSSARSRCSTRSAMSSASTATTRSNKVWK